MRVIKILIFIFVLSTGVTIAQTAAAPQSSVTPEMRAAANKLYLAQDWAGAAKAYEAISKAEPNNASALFRYGMSLHNTGDSAKAAPFVEKAIGLAPNPVMPFHLARIYARLGDREKVYATLEKVIPSGTVTPENMRAQVEFAAMLEEARFKELMSKADLAANPCKAAPEYRQFDFWIGEWDVRPAAGPASALSSSSIQLILGKCIIFENWSGAGGTNGKSFNIFDVKDKKWHQNWVDDKGTYTHYVGGLENGSMVLTADTIGPNGQKTLAKMTFTPLADGTVRQQGESSTDEGKTWTTTFDFIYMKKQQ